MPNNYYMMWTHVGEHHGQKCHKIVQFLIYIEPETFMVTDNKEASSDNQELEMNIP